MTHMIELWGWRVSYKMNAQQSGSLLYCQFIQRNSSRGDSFFYKISNGSLSGWTLSCSSQPVCDGVWLWYEDYT